MGVMLVLLPDYMGSIFFNVLSPEALFFIRICGATLLGYAALNYFTARLDKLEYYKIAAWSNLVTLLTATILSTLATVQFNNNMLLFTFQHALFASGFAYTIFRLK